MCVMITEGVIQETEDKINIYIVIGDIRARLTF